MKVSYKWLSEYVSFPSNITPDRFRREMSRVSVEVEGYSKLGGHLDNIVVGEIIKVSKHPNADKLKICQVAIGDERRAQIVCGGLNVDKNMKVAIALPGAHVRWHGEGELIRLTDTVIRGEESHGMICASEELGLSASYPNLRGEILNLGLYFDNPIVGQSIASLLGLDDVIFDIENKTLSNRPDLWGQYGLARECAAVFNLEFKALEELQIINGDQRLNVSVENINDCPRYMGVVLDNIVIAPSPAWLRFRLESLGLRSINNIVDITNYLMLELGQPMHAFDFSKIQGCVNVRRANEKESIDLLDGTTMYLDQEVLLIADDYKALALAGVMGGASSQVSQETSSILLECANFDAGLIRKTTTRFGFRTDSSIRFEKSLDPYLCKLALSRAVALIREILPEAQVKSSVADHSPALPSVRVISLTYEKIYNVLGTELVSREFIKERLLKLGFIFVREEEVGFDIRVPSWRATKDIVLPEDVIEEILRMYGYDKIESSEARAMIGVPIKNERHRMARSVRNFLSFAQGMNEVYTYSFVSPESIKKLGESTEGYLELQNPIADDTPFLRKNLLTNLLPAVEKNLRFYESFGLYEIGRVFLPEDGLFFADRSGEGFLPKQPISCAGVFVDNVNQIPYFIAKKAVTQLLNHLNIRYEIRRVQPEAIQSWMHPLRCAVIETLNDVIGYIAEIHPAVAKRFGIEKRVGVFSFDFEMLVSHSNVDKSFIGISKYPAIIMDISISIDDRIEWLDIKKLIIADENNLIESVELFDEFINDQLRSLGKKSLSIRIVYQREDRTLSHEEAVEAHSRVLAILEKSFGATLRK